MFSVSGAVLCPSIRLYSVDRDNVPLPFCFKWKLVVMGFIVCLKLKVAYVMQYRRDVGFSFFARLLVGVRTFSYFRPAYRLC